VGQPDSSMNDYNSGLYAGVELDMGGGGGQRRPVLARAPMVVAAVVECVGVDAGVDAETFSP
jgi:hypothetical protein